MKLAEVNSLESGIYRIHWSSGGESLAAVGLCANGDRWMAPTNWITPSARREDWGMVLFVEKIDRLKE